MAKRKTSRRSRGKTAQQQAALNNLIRTLIGLAAALAAILGVNHYMGGPSPWEGLPVFDGSSSVSAPAASVPASSSAPSGSASGEATTLRFLDVGQADATLIQQGSGFILIDAADSAHDEELIHDLQAAGVQTIDLLIMTHPHADHIGAMADVLETFTVKQVLLPDFDKAPLPTTRTFEKVLEQIETQNIPTVTAAPGWTFTLGEGTLTVLGAGVETKNYNELSIAGRFDSPDLTYLFTGDGESGVEQDLLDSGANLSAQVYKAGHHGSSTSSGEKFLSYVRPQISIISCGVDNDYGHPDAETLDKLNAIGAQIYRTDLQGTITVRRVNGQLQVETEKEAA